MSIKIKLSISAQLGAKKSVKKLSLQEADDAVRREDLLIAREIECVLVPLISKLWDDMIHSDSIYKQARDNSKRKVKNESKDNTSSTAKENG